MRFMMLIKANRDTEAGVMPGEKTLAAMAKYNEELLKAGALLDLAGLHPSSRGARLRFSGGTSTVIDGPFKDAKDRSSTTASWGRRSGRRSRPGRPSARARAAVLRGIGARRRW